MFIFFLQNKNTEKKYPSFGTLFAAAFVASIVVGIILVAVFVIVYIFVLLPMFDKLTHSGS
jgi:preprotein translocase subunit SecD